MIKEDTRTRLMQMAGLQICDMMKKKSDIGESYQHPFVSGQCGGVTIAPWRGVRTAHWWVRTHTSHIAMKYDAQRYMTDLNQKRGSAFFFKIKTQYNHLLFQYTWCISQKGSSDCIPSCAHDKMNHKVYFIFNFTNFILFCQAFRRDVVRRDSQQSLI